MRSTPQTPPTFAWFAAQFHQDTWVLHRSLESAVGAALGALTQPQKVELRRYLESVRDDQGVSFRRRWNETSSALNASDEAGARSILAATLAQLGAQA
jgi:hypothetical protein